MDEQPRPVGRRQFLGHGARMDRRGLLARGGLAHARCLLHAGATTDARGLADQNFNCDDNLVTVARKLFLDEQESHDKTKGQLSSWSLGPTAVGMYDGDKFYVDNVVLVPVVDDVHSSCRNSHK